MRAGESDTLSFGALNLLRYEQGGRSPSQEEWDALENLTGGLFRHLSDPLRRRFLSSRLPWWVPQFAVALGCIAMVAKIATGEEPEDYGRAPKDPASVALGRKGGNSEGGRHVGTQAKRDCEEGR